jgi:TPR repeat protein
MATASRSNSFFLHHSLLLAASFLCSCATKPPPQLAISPSNSFILDRKALKIEIKNAEDGNVSSMHKLYFHYAYGWNDASNAMYWAQKAGDTGDTDMQETVLCYYFRYADLAKAKELQTKWGVKSECAP